MRRKDFLKKGIFGLGSIVAVPVIYACSQDAEGRSNADACVTSPTETKGPFPNRTPREMVMANIKSDRTGAAFLINLTIQNTTANCAALAGAKVDIWHCDKEGTYSEYGGASGQHFLRGRQTTDMNGKVSFLSIYPGWYSGRAPHLHIEVMSAAGKSLLVTQLAFPEDINTMVYASSAYASRGKADTSNTKDNVFGKDLPDELAAINGNLTDGFTLAHAIKVRV